MNKTGRIIGVNQNRAIVQIDRTGECGDKCAGCSGGCDIPTIEVEVENTLDAKKGDYVNIVMEHKTLISSSFILYTIPLIAFILGVFIGVKSSNYYMFGDDEIIGLITGFLALIITYSLISFLTRSLKDVIKMESKIERFDI